MTYYNPVFRYGVEKFVEGAADAGISGLIIPDIPVEEAAELKNSCEKHGLDLIFLVAPTTTEERITEDPGKEARVSCTLSQGLGSQEPGKMSRLLLKSCFPE